MVFTRRICIAVALAIVLALAALAAPMAWLRWTRPVPSRLAPGPASLMIFNDPLLVSFDPQTAVPYEWQFSAADVGAALDITSGSSSVVVGTIDSGAADIPDLAGKVDSRWTVSKRGVVTRNTGGNDYLGHGSAVASLIAANGFGMAGFGGATHIIAMRVPELNDVAVAAALAKLDSLGVRIVNMSFGGPNAEGPVALAAIHKAEADGLLIVAAAGNYNGAVAHPAADLQTPGGGESAGLAVGASDASGNLAFFSNSGDNLSLLAPGNYKGTCSGVLVAAPLNDDFVDSCYPSFNSGGAWYSYVSGTSFAAPEVAGIAALVWAVRPTLKNYQVADIIKQSAHRSSGWTSTTGCGTLDAGAALALAVSRTAADWAATSPGAATCSATG
jgi:thermitase